MISARDWYANPTFVEHRGRKIFYTEAGHGEPLVFLHGFPTSSWDWVQIWPALTERYRCIAFDFLGFGYSDKPTDHRYTMHEQADITESVLAHAGVERFELVAHDYGVTVAQELLARQHEAPDYAIASVLLFNGGLFPETHRARLIQKLLLSPVGPLLNRMLGFSRFAKSFSAVFGPDTQPSEHELREFWRVLNHPDKARVTHALIHYITDRREHRERWVDALRRSSVPIRLVNGSVDPVSGAHLVDRYREIVDPDVDVVALEQIGHYPQVEAPQACIEAMLEFYDAQPLPSGR
ncbi:MAG: alpha/beta fold hydrolase [Nannocystaceae bacterium]|nr:alpha/beta hydrolase [bacterium]